MIIDPKSIVRADLWSAWCSEAVKAVQATQSAWDDPLNAISAVVAEAAKLLEDAEVTGSPILLKDLLDLSQSLDKAVQITAYEIQTLQSLRLKLHALNQLVSDD